MTPIIDLNSILKKGQKIDYNHLGENKIFSDKSLIRKIIINLASNAVKFSPENSLIVIRTEISDKKLILKVSDKGIGISDEDKKHLFERFFIK